MEEDLELAYKKRRSSRKWIGCAIKVLVLIVIFIVGFLIGYFIKKAAEEKSSTHSGAAAKAKFHTAFQDSVSAAKLEENVRYFSQRPHIAGSKRQVELADKLKSLWKNEFNFDKVETTKYKVLLSKPDKNKTNQVRLLVKGVETYRIKEEEQIAEPSENDTEVVRPVLGYTPSGTVEGQLVYVNYGRVEDFETLERTLNVSVKNKIAIMRYGAIYRGDKVKNAATYGAIGALIYSDPADYAPEGTGVNDTYPNTQWLPPTGVQRGSTFKGAGDPLTPGLPSLDGIYRIQQKDSELPTIPAHPISYGDAIHFLSNMTGADPPADWKGKLNISYKVGPGFTVQNTAVRMEIHNQYIQEYIHNVIGTIYGEEEPDRYVLIGNHRDSWVFGAVDAVSGTAVTTEIARGLGLILKEGWRPRRTIKMCSWGGEEYGLIGSVEWVEQNAKILSERAVAYINLDSAVSGNFVMTASASPLLKGSILSWTKKIKDPNAHDEKESMSDIMLERVPDRLGPGEPYVGNLGSGSDYAWFYQHIGVSSLDLGHRFGYKNRTRNYPVYHSQHDTYNWVKRFADPQFLFHKAMSQLGGAILLDYTDSPLLPMSVSRYALALNSSLKQFQRHYSAKFKSQNISTGVLDEAVAKFSKASKDFEARLAAVKEKEDAKFYVLRQLNDQMMFLERAFINPYGLPGRNLVRHVIFAPDSHNTYGSASFPGITDVLFDVEKTGNWAEVEKQISVLATCVLSAADVLAPLTSKN